MKKGNLLIVDDNTSVLTALELLLQPQFETIITSSSPNHILKHMETHVFDVILLDMNYSAGINSGNEGLYWLKRILEIDADSSVIMITAYGDVELAVKAVKEGAVDFILKPWDNNKLIATINSAVKLNSSRKEVRALKLKEKELKLVIVDKQKHIVGQSPAFQQVMKIVDKVADTDANILITGENGTGKELIAHDIHLKSGRQKEIFVNVDMGALTETLFESELFGHVKGAFTDAREDRIGKFEIANDGTLFLDEIANVSLPLQAKLLTVIQNREIVKVGSNKTIPIDIRLICATNANLDEMVKNGLFREDLLYRINTIQIEMPPLRQRISDIMPLANFFLKKYSEKYKKNQLRFNLKALKKLEQYHWPGNIRELQHTIEKIVILSENDIITPDDFLFTSSASTFEESYTGTLEEMEQKMILQALSQHNRNLSVTAERLGITRQTLYNKLKKYNL